jgi:hypothetical protein
MAGIRAAPRLTVAAEDTGNAHHVIAGPVTVRLLISARGHLRDVPPDSDPARTDPSILPAGKELAAWLDIDIDPTFVTVSSATTPRTVAVCVAL